MPSLSRPQVLAPEIPIRRKRMMHLLEVPDKAIFMTRVIKRGPDPGGRVVLPEARAAACACSNDTAKDGTIRRIPKHLLFSLRDKLGEQAEPRTSMPHPAVTAQRQLHLE